MTVSTQISREDYTGNGVTTVFPYRFRIFNESSLNVVRTDTNGIETPLVLNTDYSVSGVRSYSGGSITLNAALALNFKLAIVRQLPTVQETDIRNQGNFFPEVHEDVFDYMTMLIQQNDEALTRALLKPVGGSHYYDAKNLRIVNLADPLLPQDAATKQWVDLQYSVPTEEAKQAAREAKEARDEAQVIADKFGLVDTAIDQAEAARDGAVLNNAQSGINADRAEAAATAAAAAANEYPDVPTAQAAIDAGQIPVGAYFNVRSPSNNSWVDEYRNIAGVATPTGKSIPSAALVEAIRIAQQFLSSVIPQLDSNALEGHHLAVTPLDRTGGIMAIDDDAGVGFAGMPDVIQDRVGVITDANTRKRFAGFSVAFTEISGRGGFLVFDDNAGLLLPDMNDAVQDRLKVISETQIAKILSGAGIQAVTLSNDKTKAFDYFDDDGNWHLCGVDGPVQDILNGSSGGGGSYIRIFNNKPALVASQDATAPLWSDFPVVSAVKLLGSGGFVFTYDNGTTLKSSMLPDTEPKGAYKARELSASTTTVHMIANTGQSLSVGQEGATVSPKDPALTGRALMFSGAGQDRGDVTGNAITADSLGALTDASPPTQSIATPIIQRMLYNMTSRGVSTANQPVLLVRTHGFGGAGYSLLKKGTPTYANGQTEAAEAKRQLASIGKTLVIDALTITHGEFDSASVTAPGQYAGYLEEWANDHQADYVALTGQATPPKISVNQMGSRIRTVSPTTGDVIYGDWVANDQRTFANSRADAFMSCAKYPLNILYPLDIQHLKPLGYALAGEYEGQAIDWMLYDTVNNPTHAKWKPVQPVSWTLSGSTLDLTFDSPLGYPLTIDTTTLGAAPNHGFDIEGGAVAVTSVTQTGDFTFRVVFASAPPAGSILRIGFNNNVPAGFPAPYENWTFPLVNIRDTSPRMSKYTVRNLYNWCLLCRIPFN